MKKATIYDYVRMCKGMGACFSCPLCSRSNGKETCDEFLKEHPGKANKIILNWCKEHPVETRRDRLLKAFPKIRTNAEGQITFCPKLVEYDYECDCINVGCSQCRNEYWLAEVEE